MKFSSSLFKRIQLYRQTILLSASSRLLQRSSTFYMNVENTPCWYNDEDLTFLCKMMMKWLFVSSIGLQLFSYLWTVLLILFPIFVRRSTRYSIPVFPPWCFSLAASFGGICDISQILYALHCLQLSSYILASSIHPYRIVFWNVRNLIWHRVPKQCDQRRGTSVWKKTLATKADRWYRWGRTVAITNDERMTWQ